MVENLGNRIKSTWKVGDVQWICCSVCRGTMEAVKFSGHYAERHINAAVNARSLNGNRGPIMVPSLQPANNLIVDGVPMSGSRSIVRAKKPAYQRAPTHQRGFSRG